MHLQHQAFSHYHGSLCVLSLDFWTTKCTRCPSALDKLDTMAKDEKYANVNFVSICCDQLDGARDIIEKDADPRWQNVDHYYMDKKNKEQAKKLLGFKSVPFYVVLNESGEITQLGNEKAVDFESVPGVIREESDEDSDHSFSTFESESPAAVERVFNMDDLDF